MKTKQTESHAPALKGLQHADLAIIGGGIIGLSIAFECAQHGYNVTVIEKGNCGGQATGAAAGMLAPYSEIGHDPDPFFNLCQYSLGLYPDWQEQVKSISGLDFEYSRTGSLHLALHEADELALETRLEWQQKFGVKGEIVRGETLRRMEPHLTTEAIAALYYPDEHHLFAPDYVIALLEACRKLGVTIIEDAGEVRFKELAKDGVLLETERQGDVSADISIVASGAWTGFFEEQLNVRLPVYPIRGQICAYQQGEERIHHIIFSSQGYILEKANGTIVSGASEDIAGFDTQTTELGINRLTRWSGYLFSFLENKEPIHRWAGLRPATQDGHPLLGYVADYPQVIMASGHYRNGILLAPATAKVVADLLKGRQPEVDLSFFDPNRFM